MYTILDSNSISSESWTSSKRVIRSETEEQTEEVILYPIEEYSDKHEKREDTEKRVEEPWSITAAARCDLAQGRVTPHQAKAAPGSPQQQQSA